MRDRIIEAHAGRYLLRLMDRTTAVSPAGYYVSRARLESRWAVPNRELLTDI